MSCWMMDESETRTLSETENKIYLVLSLIFEKIMDAEASYEMGLFQWQKARPEILANIGLTDDLWTSLSDFGDQNDDLQERLADLREKYENYSRDYVLTNITTILQVL